VQYVFVKVIIEGQDYSSAGWLS